VIGGVYNNRIAMVYRIAGDKIFLKDHAIKRNSGLFVVNANNCFVL